MKKVFIAVTNDLITDFRIQKIATTLKKSGFFVLLIGRYKNTESYKYTPDFNCFWFRLLFNTGPLFYFLYNVRLLNYLIFNKFDIIVSNDLDTLPACFLAAKIKNKALVYDSHELFTEVPELVNRKFVKYIWTVLEKIFLPRVSTSYTVCESISTYYNRKYARNMQVILNAAPFLSENIGVKRYSNVILYQGAVNIARGLELIIDTLEINRNLIFWIVGQGDILSQLKSRVIMKKLRDRVLFFNRQTPEQLRFITPKASVGVSVEANTGLSYYYALPNKLFDYIQARIPVLVSNFPEMAGVVTKYQIGMVLTDRSINSTARILNYMVTNTEARNIWLTNLNKAANDMNWENEEKKIQAIFTNLS